MTGFTWLHTNTCLLPPEQVFSVFVSRWWNGGGGRHNNQMTDLISSIHYQNISSFISSFNVKNIYTHVFGHLTLLLDCFAVVVVSFGVRRSKNIFLYGPMLLALWYPLPFGLVGVFRWMNAIEIFGSTG